MKRDEDTFIPQRDERWREQEEAWLEFALRLARKHRGQADRLRHGSNDWFHEDAARQVAVECARAHINSLRRAGFTVSHLLADMALAEGLDAPITHRAPLETICGCGNKSLGYGERCTRCEASYQIEQRGLRQC